jgi:hypothetical protein
MSAWTISACRALAVEAAALQSSHADAGPRHRLGNGHLQRRQRILLTPLPYPDSGRLVNLWSYAPGLGLDHFSLSPDLYFFLRRESRSYAEMTTYRRRDANLTETTDPEVVPAIEATSTYFSTMGIAPARGQAYTATHDAPGAQRVVVISDRLWHRRFGANPSAVGASAHRRQPLRFWA